jgi:hypothetical protein
MGRRRLHLSLHPFFAKTEIVAIVVGMTEMKRTGFSMKCRDIRVVLIDFLLFTARRASSVDFRDVPKQRHSEQARYGKPSLV